MTDFRKSYPIDFSLFDKNSENVLYIEDHSDQHLTLQIENVSTQDITLHPLTGNTGAANYHFALCFRAGTLSGESLLGAKCIELTDHSTPDWEMMPPQLNVGGMDVIYLKNKNGGMTFKPKSPEPNNTANRITIQFNRVCADARGGARGTRVMLHSANMSYDNSLKFDNYREIHLGIINHRGKKVIPLQAGFVGCNTVVNDGVVSNNLKLRITNIAPFDPANPSGSDVVFNADTKFILSFQAGLNQDEFALADAGAINRISIPATKYFQVNAPQQTKLDYWTILPATVILKSVADPKQGLLTFIDIDIKEIKTDYAFGHTHLYLHYENIPGYWDGTFVCMIEKSPVKIEAGAVEVYSSTGKEAQLQLITRGDAAITRYVAQKKDTDPKIECLKIGAYGGVNNIESYARELVIKNGGTEIARFADINAIKLQKGNAGYNVADKDKVALNQVVLSYYNNGKHQHAIKSRHNNDDGNGNSIDFYVWDKKKDKDTEVGTLHTMSLNDGKVGIGGITDPQASLHVNGEIKCAKLNVAGAGTDAIEFSVNGRMRSVGTDGGLFCDDKNESFVGKGNSGDGTTVFGLYNNGWGLTVNGSGDVSIHKKLFLKQFKESEWQWVSYDNSTGEVKLGKLSDKRLKQNIAALPNALQVIQAIRGVSYQWNEEGLQQKTKDIEENYRADSNIPEDNAQLWETQKQRIRKENARTFHGFIAQEIEQTFPDWVRENEDGYKTINMEELTPVLVEAIKAQQQQINSLQEQMERLLKEVAEMKASMQIKSSI
jgi:hypothetical protein